MKLPSLTLFALFCLFSFVGILTPAYAGNDEHKSWDYPPFGATDVALYQAFQASCSRFAAMPSGKVLGGKRIFGTVGQWQTICAEGLSKKATDLEDYLHTRLAKVKMSDNGKFTGYYKPVMEGSRKRHGEYQTPLLARPKDLTICNGQTGQLKANGQCINPYPQRSEIMANLKSHKVLMWMKDPVDVYFLHIQGSGTVELDDGTVAHIGFDGKNGHPYVAIGKVLKDMGELKGSITADKIREWLKKNPKRNDEVLHANPSYIFFKETKEESPGAFGVTLTGGRSLAVDKSSVPLGVPVQVETTNTYDNSPWSRLMFAQDVGSAIKGPGRGDIYFGHGPLAGKRAGSQNATGSLYAYVPKENVGEQAVAELKKEEKATEQAAPRSEPKPQAPQQLAALQQPQPQPERKAEPVLSAELQPQTADIEPAAGTTEPAEATEASGPQTGTLAENTPPSDDIMATVSENTGEGVEETTTASVQQGEETQPQTGLMFKRGTAAAKITQALLNHTEAPNPLADSL